MGIEDHVDAVLVALPDYLLEGFDVGEVVVVSLGFYPFPGAV